VRSSYPPIMRVAILLAVVALGGAHTAAAASSPSPSTCAAAWNHQAGARLRALVVAGHANGAFISSRASVGVDMWSKAGGTSSTTAPGCTIQFILPSNRLLVLWGAWRGTAIPKWTGPVSGARSMAIHGNARVHDDGTVGFHG
jgi:hypothetical protein